MKNIILPIYLLFLVPVMLLAQNKNGFPVQVKTENGLIEGNFDTKTGIQKYFGIPFAQPPVAELRWKAPQPVKNWSGVKMTKAFGPRPVQKLVFGDMNSRSDGVSEDCLYLNVWTPARRNSKDLPVLVYFYGGGNVAGDASEPRYDGESMAEKGIVVVTCNYRLGIFGFLAHKDLSAEAPYHSSGNYGSLDQLAALKWVKENIAAFGGNPNHVTIAGESAGSIGVSTQMASPLTKGLIHGAIGESGAAISPTMPPIDLATAEKMGQDFLSENNIASIAALRKLSTADIYELGFLNTNPFRFPLVIDGYFLPKNLVEIFESKEQSMVPLLAGWNSAEIPGVAFMQGAPFTPEAFVKKVKEVYPNNSDEVLALHPHANAEEVAQSATNLAADRFISYSTWKWLDLHAKNSNQPVYRYLYSKLRPPLVDQSLTPGLAGGTMKADKSKAAPKALGAPHACEIEYAMGNLDRIKEYAWTPEDYKVSQTMEDFFANFIKNGNPNGSTVPTWSPVKGDDSKPPYMVIDVDSKEVQSDHDARYRLHDKLFGNAK
ncbi:carboxylesterase family protein [Marinilongibacter aquaticus]|uniref:carboxylesterase/lipase family protein n=1 Tax=Marinilongibacter aquaticus TaxID=2975157 RepID=UPI0021BD3DDA|nr:carboxylesterase family protein [Marinilongibacter aquaticus]UBM57910.1 carboxylesterase family protein [Marinilongibacter aquaticus]